jgi:hypothetical protein
MNYPQQSAQGLASLGRNGDSMLVHMTPREVSGLQSLAMAHGGSLSINPDTGLPEASFLGGLLDFALPIAGSFFGMDPFLVAGLMGGKKLIETGDIGQAALAGFGSYGGAKIGEGLKSFSTPPSIPTSAVNAIENAPYTGVLGNTGQLGADLGFKAGPMGATEQLASSVGNIDYAMPKTFGSDALTKTNPIDFGVKDITNASNQNYFIEPTSATPTTGMSNVDKLYSAKPVGVELPGATQAPSSFGQFGDAVSTAAKDPVGFAKEVGGGSAGMGALKLGMYGASPFMEDILNPPAMEMATSDAEKYDPNRRLYLGNDTGLRLLPNLNLKTAKEGGEIKAYAPGGTVTTGGLRDLYATTDSSSNPQLSRDGYGVGRLENLARQQAMTQAQTTGYADGGDVASGDLSAENAADLAAFQMAEANNPSGLYGVNSGGYGITAPTRNPTVPSYSVSPEMQRSMAMKDLERQRLAAYIAPSYRRGMAQGGYLDGQGDGMSDSIPATIEGKQPARLADGEFVVPADVVSHLGNGSSKAGSKRLYAMLDKVRHARTGNKKQGREIKAEKYVPKVA